MRGQAQPWKQGAAAAGRRAAAAGGRRRQAASAHTAPPTDTCCADNIYIQPQDLRAFEPWLPINGGNRTVLLLGARSGNASGDAASSNSSADIGSGGSLGGPVVLDFGGAVDLMYHPVGCADGYGTPGGTT